MRTRFSLHAFIATSFLALLALAALGQLNSPSGLERMQASGRLVAAMRTGAASYQPGEHSKPDGFEYELLRGFADKLGVNLVVRVVANADEAMALLENNAVDIVAATVSPTPARRRRFAFSDSYLTAQPRIVYRRGTRAPENIADLAGNRVEALAHTVHAQRLSAAAARQSKLAWQALPDVTGEELLYRVWRGRSDYALTDDFQLALNQPFYPELRAAFAVGPARKIAWMLPIGERQLRQSANVYLSGLRRQGLLAVLRDEYFGHLSEFDYVGTRTFLRHITKRLPRFRALFQGAADKFGIDWQLLAAVGYQESHWNPKAVSPTGVRGIMMLTRSTADFVGIDDRRDPKQSINGGAEYLASLRARLPKAIKDPDRTWFTLAAYNVGLGHLYDAQKITRMRGGDVDRWFDIRESLPLLADKQWYTRVRHGYARGQEPVRYVENIRRYYELLRRVMELGPPLLPTIAQDALLPNPLRVPPALESIL